MSMTYRIAPDWIDGPIPGRCFVFGANAKGVHDGGASRTARQHFGAIDGRTGDMGSCWGIVTRDRSMKPPQRIPVETVHWDIRELLKVARNSPQREFLVTAIGCGFAKFTPEEIAPAFRDCSANVLLPKVFVDVLTRGET